MAIVETLEIRFTAKLGNLGAQIAAITASLGSLGGASAVAMGSLSASALIVGSALKNVNLNADAAEKKQTRLASKLKKTSRALGSVSNAARKAAVGIGLHKLDEVNLVGSQEKKSSSGGGSASSSGGGSGVDLGAAEKLKKLQEAVKTLPGFFERLYRSLRDGMDVLDQWIDKATGGLAGDMIKSLGNLGKKAAEALRDKLGGDLKDAGPTVFSQGRSLVSGLVSAIKNSASADPGPGQAGSGLAGRLASGILSGRQGVKSAASTVTLAAKFGGEDAKKEASGAGSDLSRGFANGILSCLDRVRSAASKLASTALYKIRDLLKIASPSKVTFETGGYFAEGFANGISSGVNLAGQSAADLARGAAMALNMKNVSVGGDGGMSGMVKAAVNEALGDTSIVIPLNVDGIRLGEASIRGINRVTRAAGRLMLEI